MAEPEQATGARHRGGGSPQGRPGVSLGDLADRVGGQLHASRAPRQRAEGPAQLRIGGVTQDSRRVEPGDLFVALQGATVDGGRYAVEAADRGAAAVLTERGRPIDAGLPWCEVPDPRRAMATAAAAVHGEPTAALAVIGITGTNGKTTTAHLLRACMTAAGQRVAIIGTVGHGFEDLAVRATHTSPESDELQRLAAEMLRRGATHLVMEVSSIALVAQRVAEIQFDVAVFTNLSQDHLDYHGDMDRYAAAKDSLFLDHRPRAAVINVADAHGAELAARLRAAGETQLRRVAAGGGADVDVFAQDLRLSAAGIEMTVRMPTAEVAVRSPLVGLHNVDNVLAALAAVELSGLDVAAAATALSKVSGAPGRLERCDEPGRDEVIALVDYAHTPAALTRVLDSVRAMTPGRVWCVFGCGGDRDAAKRLPMGAAVGSAADVAVVTNDNPRGESSQDIAAAVVEGLKQAAASSYRVELDRRAAIDWAVRNAAAGDVVLVAGKGHETEQIIGTDRQPFDDRVVTRQALRARRGAEGR